MARSLGVKVYTVGVGTKGPVPYPFTDSLGIKRYKNIRIDLDEETLKMIAQKTNGKYLRATDTESLKNVYKEINNLEKTEIKGKKFTEYDDLFGKFLMIGLIILFSEITLENTFLRKIP